MDSVGMIYFILGKFNVLTPCPFLKISNSAGLSNAIVWKVSSISGIDYALKAYPSKALGNLRSSHLLMSQAFKNGFHSIPLVINSNENDSLVYYYGFYWELTTWVQGVIPIVSKENLIQAVQRLGEFHSIVGLTTHNFGVMPAWENRLNEIQSIQFSSLLVKNPKFTSTLILSNAIQLLEWCLQEVPKILTSSNPQSLIQFCWGDARRENVLFENSSFSGFIDFYTARLDSKEVDVSRLISSFVADDYELWKVGLDEYRKFFAINYSVCRKLDILGTVVALKRWVLWCQESVNEENAILRFQRLGNVMKRVQEWKKHGSLRSMLFFD